MALSVHVDINTNAANIHGDKYLVYATDHVHNVESSVHGEGAMLTTNLLKGNQTKLINDMVQQLTILYLSK